MATDAPSALRILDHHPEVQLLFTDVGLPGLNGRELVDKAREQRPYLKVLFTSGYARNAIVHQGRLDAGVELLTKPFTRTQLASRIRDVLDATVEPLGKPRTALVIEDEPLVRMFLVESLQDLGFAVVQGSSAAEGLLLAQSRNEIEIAFVDIGLPDRSGLEVAQQLRSRWPQLPIAIASGYADRMDAEFRNDPRVTYMSKPYDEPAIRQALARLGMAG
jgi:CheY-like chemotaxis protein